MFQKCHVYIFFILSDAEMCLAFHVVHKQKNEIILIEAVFYFILYIKICMFLFYFKTNLHRSFVSKILNIKKLIAELLQFIITKCIYSTLFWCRFVPFLSNLLICKQIQYIIYTGSPQNFLPNLFFICRYIPPFTKMFLMEQTFIIIF